MAKRDPKPSIAATFEPVGAQSRPGGRAAKVVAAVRRVTLEMMAENGFDGVEIPEIAARAGVNRTTVYRRWSTKTDLILDVLLDEMRAKVPTPDTGSFQHDLEQLLARIAEVLANPLFRDLFHLLSIQRPNGSEDYGKMRRAFWEERFSVSGEIVARAIARGEVPPGASARAILELGAAPLFYRILALGEPVDPKAIADIAAWAARQDLEDLPAATTNPRLA